MTLRQRLRSIIEHLPAGAAVTLPADTLRVWLDDEPSGAVSADSDRALVDLTVAAAAGMLGRGASTIRWWCASGLLAGAYRLNGREWRIPRDALRALATASRIPRASAPARGGSLKLGAWRGEAPALRRGSEPEG